MPRLSKDDVYRLGLADPLAFDDWTAPTAAEMNANPTNNPSGLIWNLSCAIAQDGSTFDLEDPELDTSLTFCQVSGDGTPMTENATVVFEFERAIGRWLDASDTTVPTDTTQDGFNTANLALSLMAWRGVEFFAWMSIGKEPDEAFAVGDDISLIRVSTDYGIDTIGTGENARMVQTFGFRSDLLWRHTITA